MLTARKRSSGQGNFFASIFHSVHKEGPDPGGSASREYASKGGSGSGGGGVCIRGVDG